MSAGVLNLYEMSPFIYDEYMVTEMEKRNFDAVLDSIKRHRKPQGFTSVLDMCCGTGLFRKGWLSELENIVYAGVDINQSFIRYAKLRTPDMLDHYVHGDAASVDLRKEFDFVIGTSAYHHIKDEEKVKFLENMKKHLKKDGKAVIYEKFIHPFTNRIEAARSGITFYTERIYDMMQKENLSETQLFALYNELYLTSVRKDEYKVPYAHFRKDLKKTGFKIIEEKKLWPEDNRFKDQKVGDFVLVLRKKKSYLL